MTNEIVEVDVEILAMTDLAILVTDSGDPDDGVWVPKSQIQDVDESWEVGDNITMSLPEWLALDKGFI